MIVAIGTLFIGISTAVAQGEERRFVDRLLIPDTSLVNPAQNKKFRSERATSFDKQAQTHPFYPSRKPVAKTFAETDRACTPRQFNARHFRAGDSAAYIASRSQPIKDDKLIALPAVAASTRVAPASSEVAPSREYASNQTFLDKGKSAKSLPTQNKPLTIEQVRELLNKSK